MPSNDGWGIIAIEASGAGSEPRLRVTQSPLHHGCLRRIFTVRAGQQGNSSERDGCLNHHQNLGQRESMSTSVCKNAVLREEKRSIRVGALEISPVGATGIQHPVSAGKD
jgi:hypothetical protein